VQLLTLPPSLLRLLHVSLFDSGTRRYKAFVYAPQFSYEKEEDEVLDNLNRILPGHQQQIELTASTEVLAVVTELGRTEDVKFSPNNRRLAVVAFARNKVVIFDVQIAAATAGKRVSLTDAIEITSSSFEEPHGLSFIDEATIIVANRGGEASILRLPPSGTPDKKIELPALLTIGSDQTHQLKTPGSVSVSRVDQNLYEVLICNNYVNYVTRHILEGGERFVLTSNEILLNRGLRVPDGVAVNKDRRWIAVSNHDTHSVFLYENTPQLNRHSVPDGVLRNVNFPHGVRFTSDDNFVLVADAGAPYVNVYAKDGTSWNGARDPVSAFRVMDESIYRRGRYNPAEGGPKGIDIDGDMNVLVTTCDHQALAFFDLPGLLHRRRIPLDWRKKSISWRAERIKVDLLLQAERMNARLRRRLQRLRHK
jgi:DNA-binding beta-propeller fold protein YncE